MPFAATWMHTVIIILSQVSQKGKDKDHIISLTCVTFFEMLETEGRPAHLDHNESIRREYFELSSRSYGGL